MDIILFLILFTLGVVFSVITLHIFFELLKHKSFSSLILVGILGGIAFILFYTSVQEYEKLNETYSNININTYDNQENQS